MWVTIPSLALRAALPVRPELSGTPEHVDVDRFRIWYTHEGDDAVAPSDDDGDGLPDLVDAVAVGLVEGREGFEADGWRPLVDDDGAGGSGAIDVYLVSIDANGYAMPARAADDGHSCFMEIDPLLVVPGRIAESVAVHELHHCVQFRYTIETHSWVYEAAATTEQYLRVRDVTLDYALSVLWVDRLGRPDAPLDAVDGRLEYAAFAWMKFWWERDGADYARLPAMWDALAEEPGWRKALGAEADRLWGEDLGETFLHHAEWNAFACAADDGAHYRSDPLGCLADIEVPVGPWDGEPVDVELPDAFTAAYLERPDGTTDPSGPNGGEVRCEGAASAIAGDRVVVAATDGPASAICTVVQAPPPVAALRGCDHAGAPWSLGAWVATAAGLRASRRRRRA